MNTPLSDTCRHPHSFGTGNPLSERNTLYAVVLTAITMVVEIVCGYLFNSMALLADGWHMSSHVLALGLSLFAYVFARRHARDQRFAFGPWKVEILASFTSAILLILVAGLMLFHSVERLIAPVAIRYEQAVAVAVIGLVVNLICAWLLRGGHAHHDHGHGHGHAHGHQDLNLRAAYIHVITDAATSVLAIVALIGGMLWGANWLDPLMGIVGATIISVWAFGLLRDSTRILLDAEMDAPVVQEIRDTIAADPSGAKIADLHVWRIAADKYACILDLETDTERAPDYFRKLLAAHTELVHITIEINPAQPPS